MMPRDKADIYSFFLLLIFTIIFFFEPIFHDVTFYFRDLLHWCYPAKIFFVEELKNGRFPLWNPYQYLGTPYAANISMSVFYPLNVLFLILPFPVAFKYHIIIHYFLFGLFTYVFSRALRVSAFSSLLAAVAAMFSGYMVFLHSQPIFLQSAVWLPLVLYFFIKALEDSTAFTWILFTSIALSVQCFSGNPQDVLISLLFMLLIGFRKVLSAKRKSAALGALAKVFGVVGVVSLGLSAIQLVPTAELISLTSRGAGLSFDQATVYSFNPIRLLEFIVPFPFGRIIPDNTYYGHFLVNSSLNLPWTLSVYIGLLPLFFILLAILRKKSIAYLFISLSLLFLAISFGNYTPLYYLCYKIIPGFDLFRYPEKYLFAVTFSLTVLCGIGCDSFFRFNGFFNRVSLKGDASRKKERLKAGYCLVETWVACAVLLISVGYVFFLIFDSVLIAGYTAIFKKLNLDASPAVAARILLESLSHFASCTVPFFLLLYAYRKGFLRKLLFQTLVLLVLFSDLALANRSLVYYTPESMYAGVPQIISKMKTSVPGTGPFRMYRTAMEYRDQYANDGSGLSRYEKQRLWEKNTLKKNTATVYHLSYCDGYETFEIKDYVHFFRALRNDPKKLLSLLNVRYIIVPEKDTSFVDEDFYRPVSLSKRDGIKIVENTDCFERAFVVTNALCFTSKHEALSAICETDFDFATAVALESQNPCMSTARTARFPGTPFNEVCNVVAYEPDYVQIQTTVQQDAYLVLSDTYYPGWKGYVDGEKETVLRANYVLRALLVPRGSHTIEFRYEPMSFRIGSAVSALTALLMLILMFYRKKGYPWIRIT